MKVSQKGIDLVKSFEGFSSKPYLCPAGVPTIGYGTTVYPAGMKVTLLDPELNEEALEAMLQYQLDTNYGTAVNRYVQVPLTQNQFDALVSFAYNVGVGNFRSSTLLKKLNRKDYKGTAKQFGRWVYANGKKLKGLRRRRKAEKELFEE